MSPSELPFEQPDLRGKIAIVTGGSRGIGRECCLALARHGCSVAIVAKTVAEVNPKLPGTIYSVAAEVEQLGQAALPVQCDLRDEAAVEACVEKVVAAFGGVHILINNASALWWQDITDTPMSKFDLITSINVRGTFAMTRACLPHMEDACFGRIVNMSPPIQLDPGAYAGMTAYNISKYGMTMCALGVAGEYGPDSPEEPGITANTLWPATVVESQASINFELGDTSTWRKAAILADATVAICGEDAGFTGNMLIDDEYLLGKGCTSEHFLQYRFDPDTEPLRLLADGQAEGEWLSGAVMPVFRGDNGASARHGSIKRGDVKKLEEDMAATENNAFQKTRSAKL